MQDKPKLFKSNKVVLMIGLAVVIFIVISSIVIFHINADSRQSFSELKVEADELKTRAIKAQKSDNDAAAIELLEKAKAQYELAGDKSNAVDAEALLYLSKHAQ